LPKAAKASGVVLIPSAIWQMGTIKAAMGNGAGSNTRIAPVKTKSASAR
jgi:hypothetical protein